MYSLAAARRTMVKSPAQEMCMGKGNQFLDALISKKEEEEEEKKKKEKMVDYFFFF